MPDLSLEEIERMRQIVADSDRANLKNNFDLSAPRIEPYVYREYPRHVYHHGERKVQVVNSDAELKALGSEWKKEPFAPDWKVEQEPVASIEEDSFAVAEPKKGKK